MEINKIELNKQKELAKTQLEEFLGTLSTSNEYRLEELIPEFKKDKLDNADELIKKNKKPDLTQNTDAYDLNEIFDPQEFKNLDELTKKLDDYTETTITKLVVESKKKIEADEKLYQEKQEYFKKLDDNYTKYQILKDINHYNFYLSQQEYGTKYYVYYNSMITDLTNRLSKFDF